MKLSKEKRDKIAEQALSVLFHIYPHSRFTAELARELARDEEFIKSILLYLKEQSLVVLIKQNSEGVFYSRRQRWRLSNKAYQAYKEQI